MKKMNNSTYKTYNKRPKFDLLIYLLGLEDNKNNLQITKNTMKKQMQNIYLHKTTKKQKQKIKSQ